MRHGNSQVKVKRPSASVWPRRWPAGFWMEAPAMGALEMSSTVTVRPTGVCADPSGARSRRQVNIPGNVAERNDRADFVGMIRPPAIEQFGACRMMARVDSLRRNLVQRNEHE